MKKVLMSALAVSAIVLAAPASAAAVDLYVDNSGDNGMGANNCEAPAAPCQTIQHALSRPGTSDIVHIGGGNYNEGVVVGGNDSLIEDSSFHPNAAGQAVLDNTVTVTDTVTMNSTGSVSGLTIRSTGNSIDVGASATISNNVFDDGTVGTGQFGAEVAVPGFVAVSPVITGNTFDDPTPNDAQAGVAVNTPGGAAIISNNSFDGYQIAIQAFTGTSTLTPTISGNTITGTHDSIGAGISLFNRVDADLIANRIHSPGLGNPDGVVITSNNGTVAADLTRNAILGPHDNGVFVNGNPAPITLDSDLIAKSNQANLALFQNAGVGAGADATNVTIVDSALNNDIQLGALTSLELDSSIVGADATPVGVADGGATSCTITFSRGTGDASCASGFTSTADPMFVNPAANDYHLQSGSPMIDMGNTVAPMMGALDIDGNARGLAVGPPCTTPVAGRRDIGADEFVTVCPPPSTPTTPVTPAAAPKKCKKGRKLKKGKCVKKKRKKKKG